jgi:hypothetical protein
MGKEIFEWKWDEPWKNIEIFQGKTLFGTIKSFERNATSKINDKQFTIEYQGKYDQHIFITDPIDNKAYCEIGVNNEIKSPHFSYQYKRSNLLRPNDAIIFKDKKVAELNFDNILYSQKGTINIYTKKNVELLIFWLFFQYESNRESSII